ncbi:MULTISPECIES: STAS domain-containing protein [Zhenhengia]|uniref:STAS domain-containing protein n=1 Tax=Zhenhengia TaxID=2944196 RepID=UPI002016104B|nr:anti-sigma factor antagonist [Zhenhengia yiwuensis]MDU6359112.1 anti-sigma factor antagonist [Clostridiales bacterium]MDY3369432.1 anti-sigma factor antagonist [Zhenhengia yiwuensis]
MNIEFCMHDTTLIVSLSGEIDHHTSVEIRETVDREYQKRRAKNILFDFSNIVFMDSSGIGLLMGRYRNVSICGGYVGLYNVPTKVDQILNISGIYKLMKLYESKEHAFKSLA